MEELGSLDMEMFTDLIPASCGKIDKIHESFQFEWKIENFPWRYVRSPIFQYAGTSWRLIIILDSFRHDGECFIQLLGEEDGNPFPVEYKFGLKIIDDEVEILVSGILKEYEWQSDIHNVIKISDSFRRTKELSTIRTFTIICTLKQGIALNFPSSDERIETLDTVSEDFKTLLNDEDSCDTSLHVDGKHFKAHRTVLIARSSVFAAMFKHDTSEKQTGVVNIPDCDPDTFHDFLEFLYTGKLDVKSSQQAFHLYKTSDKYDLQELKTFCVKQLMRCLTVENFCFTAQFADRYGETGLLFRVQRFFNSNISQILDTGEWFSLMDNNCHLANQLLKNILK